MNEFTGPNMNYHEFKVQIWPIKTGPGYTEVIPDEDLDIIDRILRSYNLPLHECVVSVTGEELMRIIEDMIDVGVDYFGIYLGWRIGDYIWTSEMLPITGDNFDGIADFCVYPVCIKRNLK